MESWIALDVYPIVRLCGDVAAKAILCVVGRNLLVRCIGLEERPAPTVAPEGVVWKTTLGVFDHDKPHFGISGPVGISRSHLRMVRVIDLLYQHSSVSKFLVSTVVLGGSRRRVDEVHLVALRI